MTSDRPISSKEESSFAFRFAKMWHDLIGSPVMNTRRYTEAQGMMEEADAEIARLRTEHEEFVLKVAERFRGSPVETKALPPLCDGAVQVIYEHGEPTGVRDASGYLCHFNRVTKWPGQEDRYRKELALRARQAEVISNALRSAQETSGCRRVDPAESARVIGALKDALDRTAPEKASALPSRDTLERAGRALAGFIDVRLGLDNAPNRAEADAIAEAAKVFGVFPLHRHARSAPNGER